MRIELTMVDPQRHRMAVVRADGSSEAVILETRSYLVHDLAHLAVESELDLRDAFFGRLARGVALAELNDRTRGWPEGTELALAESLVGPMQGVLAGKRGAPGIEAHPSFPGIQARFRAAMGRWKGTPPREPCTLDWDDERPSRSRF